MYKTNLLAILLVATTVSMVTCKKKSGGLFTAGIVESLVRNEVQRKMPAATHSKTTTGNSLYSDTISVIIVKSNLKIV